ncbi:hypothetical protein DEF23_16470 [Marinitenerispora sediminis]|uniref:Uncharacterized protein n=2 Tax=Marinitenerispora sediminis TaxID=1931232 RepID=A0A368T9U5_9ACTN|nr:hypothetical protein DEF23_16470 [Marinitenerispora sediminis]RCV56826.1 hypothetical protein DEF28_02780 [Marinitenerispora sediminis]RCV61537.1 hypothetical protein DEF24_03950 [Marinitenerispora sediminis]
MASLRLAIATPGIITVAGLGTIALVTGYAAFAVVLGVLALLGLLDFVALARRARRGPLCE